MTKNVKLFAFKTLGQWKSSTSNDSYSYRTVDIVKLLPCKQREAVLFAVDSLSLSFPFRKTWKSVVHDHRLINRERIRKRIVIYFHTQAIAIAQDFAYHTAARTHSHTHKPMYPKISYSERFTKKKRSNSMRFMWLLSFC